MKRVSLIIPALFLFLFGSVSTFAQQEEIKEEKKKIVIVKKHIDDDGTVTIEKIVKEGKEADELIHEIHTQNEEGEGHTEIDIEIVSDGDSREVQVFQLDNDEISETQDINIEFTDEDGNKVIKMRRGGNSNNSETIEWQGQGELPADVRQKLDELGINLQQRGTGNHQLFGYTATAPSCDDKAFLGVVLKESVNVDNGVETREGITDQGIVIDDIVSGGAAEAAGLQKDDVITSISGQAIKSYSDLTNALGKQKPGDKVNIAYIRNGESQQAEATLKTNSSSVKGFKWDEDYNFDFDFDFDHHNGFTYNEERPCVFIGVYVNNSRGNSGNGAKVTGVINDTPAAEAQLQEGDVITGINNVTILNFNDLLTERNKYNPGDQVTLNINRSGDAQNVDITFRECEKAQGAPSKQKERIIIINKSKKVETIEEEDTEEIQINESPIALEQNSSRLQLENFRAFPNPTAGEVTVRFSGEAVPTSVNIVDIAGRELFSENLNTFDGFYNKRIDLSQAPVGTLLLTVRQDDKVFTQTLIRSESTGL